MKSRLYYITIFLISTIGLNGIQKREITINNSPITSVLNGTSTFKLPQNSKFVRDIWQGLGIGFLATLCLQGVISLTSPACSLESKYQVGNEATGEPVGLKFGWIALKYTSFYTVLHTLSGLLIRKGLGHLEVVTRYQEIFQYILSLFFSFIIENDPSLFGEAISLYTVSYFFVAIIIFKLLRLFITDSSDVTHSVKKNSYLQRSSIFHTVSISFPGLDDFSYGALIGLLQGISHFFAYEYRTSEYYALTWNVILYMIIQGISCWTISLVQKQGFKGVLIIQDNNELFKITAMAIWSFIMGTTILDKSNKDAALHTIITYSFPIFMIVFLNLLNSILQYEEYEVQITDKVPSQEESKERKEESSENLENTKEEKAA